MNCPYNYDEPESRLEWFEVRLAELQFEKDALWVKTQEDEREINQLRDAVDEKNKWKEEALVVLNEWNEVSEYIRKNTDINDLGKSIPDLCLKKLEVS